ncbi:MAG: FtsX-like permease family protein [Microbacterium sp.]|uniref:FtsX-like permease family protein n=1 Tax=Microbacterium sp. TaxID=51671 RepID=UPI0039E228EB
MRALILAELRAAWSSWLAVLIAFVATSFSIVLAILALDSLIATIGTGNVPEREAPAIMITPGVNLALALIGTLAVIGAVTGLVVQSRRGALARLALAGATPGQVSRILLGQLAIVSIIGSVIGVVLAIVFQPAAVRETISDRGVDPAIAVIKVDPLLILLGVGFFLLVALIGGMRQSWVAAAVPPVEALRTAPGAAVRRGLGIGRWIGGGVILLGTVGLSVLVVAAVPSFGVDGGDIVMQGSLFVMLFTSIVLSLWAPLTVSLLTRVWTALVPSRAASWVLARAAVIARGERLARTVTPIMMAVGLLVGLGSLSASISGMLHEVGKGGLEHASLLSLLFMVGLIMLISMSGGVSVVLMMSRQREAELALAGVVGATGKQQVLVPVLEGVIITVTATLLGLVMMGAGMALFSAGVLALGKGVSGRIIMPWADLGVIFAVALVIIVAATTLPVLRSLRRPARQVVAQLAAE